MALVDKLGRKPLMLIGAGGLCVLYILIVNALHSGSGMLSGLLLAAIGTYAMTLAPVIWVLISEIFPVAVRTAAITIAIISLWLAYFILVFTFPIIFERLKENTFYIYAAICAAGFLFALLRIKETKGKDLEEVEQVVFNALITITNEAAFINTDSLHTNAHWFIINGTNCKIAG